MTMKSKLSERDICTKYITLSYWPSVLDKVKHVVILLPPHVEKQCIASKAEHPLTLCDELAKRIYDFSGKQAALLNAVMAKV